ncbi:uncharacterized protein V2V93DRAFT_371429 [Kockiozyma suomiensis]|uniref:uncharacterized protein n=1 Tax=Kockiozyma suomiensis TaxID=1337062 RepID=UPI0033434DFF
MAGLSQPRRALADVSANISSSPTKMQMLKMPMLKESTRKKDTTAGEDEIRIDKSQSIALASSPIPLTPAAELQKPTAIAKPICRQHADRLRLRLRLAYYKVKHHEVSTPLSELCLRDKPVQKAQTMALLPSSFEKLSYHNIQQPHIINSSNYANQNAYNGIIHSSNYTYRSHSHNTRSHTVLKPPPISAAAAKLQSVQAVLSETAKKLAAQGDLRPQLPRKRSSGTFIHYAIDADDKRLRRKRKSTERASTNAKRARSTTSSSIKPTTLPAAASTVVTPARKRYSLPVSGAVSKLAAASASAAAVASAAQNQFSSPLKSNVPSSSVKGTPGQLGAARSLLDLGLF